MNLFPYTHIRNVQQEMIQDVARAVSQQGDLVVHAPTGLGKTAASLTPALEYALEHDKIIFFLTSRHTQHRIAIDTLRAIKEKHDVNFAVADVIGKRWMCAQPNLELMNAREFTEYCKHVRENYTCEFYMNTRNKAQKPTPHGQRVADEMKAIPKQVEDVVTHAKEERCCPYEIATIIAKDARVIVSDYNYIFNGRIRDSLLRKIERNLNDCIVIVDEGHNLPDRLREMLSESLTTFVLERALKEARKFEYPTLAGQLEQIQDVLNALAKNVGPKGEAKVARSAFADAVAKIGDYDEIASQFVLAGESIREKQRVSFVGSVGAFLQDWQGPDDGYVRMVQADAKGLKLVYRCLDPSVASGSVIQDAHSTIVMSGTLQPTSMYHDLLGMNATVKSFPSPFPSSNKLNLIIPKTTTKYSERSEDQFKRMGKELGTICNTIPGNVAVFFPSYAIRDNVYRHFFDECTKTIFQEENGMTKADKQDLLDRFKGYKNVGAVLLGVVSANFSEGVDLPGDLLQGVVVVGLPLSRPDLETNELISYYDNKFGKGWDYGYVFPAFNKTLQAAGRCIRSETDRGVIVFLDERYAWPNYIRCFPEDAKLKVTREYESLIKAFFSEN